MVCLFVIYSRIRKWPKHFKMCRLIQRITPNTKTIPRSNQSSIKWLRNLKVNFKSPFEGQGEDQFEDQFVGGAPGGFPGGFPGGAGGFPGGFGDFGGSDPKPDAGNDDLD